MVLKKKRKRNRPLAALPKNQSTWNSVGTLKADPHATETKFDVFGFGPDGTVEKALDSVDWIEKNREKFPVLWLNVEGLGNVEALSRLESLFNLHRLSLEVALDPGQRPKFESHSGYHFMVLRMLSRGSEELETEQLSLFLGHDFVLTLQDGLPGDCLDPLRERLRADSMVKHDRFASFLAYSIIDAVVDSYFPILETLGERLEELEDRILSQPTKESVRGIHDVKRELLVIRRAVWPLREAISPLFHDESGLVCPETKVFLRDCHDHCIQVIELVETYREIASSLMDVYLSSISNKMNEVMKVLTIITTIFVPLTFVAGVYGMNFNTSISPVNMPELNFYWGYPLCLGGMLTLAVFELWAFWKRGWIFQEESLGVLSRPSKDPAD